MKSRTELAANLVAGAGIIAVLVFGGFLAVSNQQLHTDLNASQANAQKLYQQLLSEGIAPEAQKPSDVVKGEPGAAGPEGAVGARGFTGPEGSTGPAGRNGKDGAPGKDGATGPAGPSGADGKDGKDGSAGPTCPAGFTLRQFYVRTSSDPDPTVSPSTRTLAALCVAN